jgi:uncharacterized protein
MQSQIAAGTTEVGRVEELMLVNMLEADEVTARLKKAEADLTSNEAVIASERKAIEAEAKEMERVVSAGQQERATLVPTLDRHNLDMFERVLRVRQGTAVAQAIDGHCSICHVRLRPQVYNTIRRNDSVVQCEHCQRILYFVGVHERSADGHAAATAPSTFHTESEPANE